MLENGAPFIQLQAGFFCMPVTPIFCDLTSDFFAVLDICTHFVWTPPPQPITMHCSPPLSLVISIPYLITLISIPYLLSSYHSRMLPIFFIQKSREIHNDSSPFIFTAVPYNSFTPTTPLEHLMRSLMTYMLPEPLSWIC